MSKCTVLSFSLLFSIAVSWSAPLKGVVTDTLTKAPVESVLVQVKGTTTQTYTNTQGVFSFVNVGIAFAPHNTQNVGTMIVPPANSFITVYRADGSALLRVKSGNLQTQRSGLPAGIYLVKAEYGPQTFSEKLVSLGQRNQIAGLAWSCSDVQTLGKARATAIALVYSHKYYNGKEAAAISGDTNISTKLQMWWPDSTNTGIPAGTTLTAYAGGTVADGAVIENKDVSSGFDLYANNVTFRKCKIRCSGGYFGILQRSGYSGLLVEDCEILSTNDSGLYTGISGSDLTVRRCNIHGWENGLSVGSNVILEDGYIHQPCIYSGAHVDGIEAFGSNVIVRHCRIMIKDETGCVNITPYNGGVSNNCVVRNNLFTGGTYSLYLRGDGGGTVSGVTVIGNVWVKGSYVYGTHSVVSVTNVTWAYNCLSDGTPVAQ